MRGHCGLESNPDFAREYTHHSGQECMYLAFLDLLVHFADGCRANARLVDTSWDAALSAAQRFNDNLIFFLFQVKLI